MGNICNICGIFYDETKSVNNDIKKKINDELYSDVDNIHIYNIYETYDVDNIIFDPIKYTFNKKADKAV